MAPPMFSGLGQAASNVLNNGYILDMVRLDFMTGQSMDIGIGVLQYWRPNTVIGYLVAKSVFKNPNYSVCLTESWNTKNVITAEATIDGWLPGVKISTDGILNRKKNSKDLRVVCEYKNNFVAANLKTEFKSLKPVINASAVVAYKNWFGGINVRYNTTHNALKSIKFAFGYTNKHITFTTTLDHNNIFGCSVYQKLSQLVELSMLVSVLSKSYYYSSFAVVGVKLQVRENIVLRAKFNNSHQLCLSSSIKLNDGIVLTLCSLFNCHKFEHVRDQFGIGLELEP